MNTLKSHSNLFNLFLTLFSYWKKNVLNIHNVENFSFIYNMFLVVQKVYLYADIFLRCTNKNVI